MRVSNWTNYLLSHRIIALALTFVFSFIPSVGVVGIIFAALVTIRKGLAEGALFTFAATLPYCFVRFFLHTDTTGIEPNFIWVIIGVGVLSNVLTWAFAAMIQKKATWSTVLQTATLMGVLLISVVHLIYPDVASWWASQLQVFSDNYVVDTLKLKESIDVESLKETQLQAINSTKLRATGAIVGATFLIAILQLIFACWWNSRVFHRGNLQRALHHIRLSRLAGVLFVVSLVLVYWENSVVLDIMPVLYLLFCAAGLSLLHYFFEMIARPVVWFWLVLMYVTLIIGGQLSIVMVATLGLLDIWVDFRKRFKKG